MEMIELKPTAVAWRLMATVLLCTIPASSFAQASQPLSPHRYFKSFPMRNLNTGTTMTRASTRAAINAADAGTLPLFDYTVTSPVDGNSYSGTIVGRSPLFHGARSTSIPTVIIPVILQLAQSYGSGVDTYDPTAPDPNCSPQGTARTLVQNSPVFNASNMQMDGTDLGNTTYSDAFERGEFWGNVSITGNAFHTMLAVTTTAPMTVAVPAGDGQSYAPSQVSPTPCENLGVINTSYVNYTLLPNLIASLSSNGVGPGTIPIFLIYNVVMADPGTLPTAPTCCVVGFHSAFQNGSGPPQFYGIADFDTTGIFAAPDVSVLSHEFAEMINDPTGQNDTPAWGDVGEVQDNCSAAFEVGQPLSGTSFPPITMNGFTYHPQELAFFSWFYRLDPSIGANGWYSDNGSFASDAGAVCQD